MLKHVWLPEFQVDTGPPSGSIDWWHSKVYDDGITLTNLTSKKPNWKIQPPIGKRYARKSLT